MVIISIELKAQIKAGITYGGDFYQRYTNPIIKGDSLLRSSGNYWLNIAMGPKIWYKGNNYSISVECPVNWGITTFDWQENKGLGSLAYPLLFKYNSGLLEGHKVYGLREFSLGAGIQYNKTEVYGFENKFTNHPSRGYFRTYIIDLGLYTHWIFPDLQYNYIRIGFGEHQAVSFNFGMMWNKVF